MIVKSVTGIFLGLIIGVGCRCFGIPLPGPPAIFGAVLTVAMATGYTMADRLVASQPRQVPPAADAMATQGRTLAQNQNTDR
jgi:XapX domain-containing protein